MASPKRNDSAKVFMSGKSQAVRLPMRFRFPADCDEVSIRQIGAALILIPRYATWEELWAHLEPVDEDFVQAVLDAKKEELGSDVPRADFDE